MSEESPSPSPSPSPSSSSSSSSSSSCSSPRKTILPIHTCASYKSLLAIAVGFGVQVFRIDHPTAEAPIRKHGGAVRSLAFSKDGRYLVTGGDDKMVRVFDEEKGGSLVGERLHVTSKKITGIVVASNGIGYVCDRAGEVWGYPVGDLATPLNLLLGQLSPFTSISLSSCETFIVNSDKDDRIRVSHAPEGYDIHGFCMGHLGCVAQVITAPIHGVDLLVSGATDQMVFIWDLVTCKLLYKVATKDLLSSAEADFDEKTYLIPTTYCPENHLVFLLSSDGLHGVLLRLSLSSAKGGEKIVEAEVNQRFDFKSKQMFGYFSPDSTLFVVGSSPLISAYSPFPSSSSPSPSPSSSSSSSSASGASVIYQEAHSESIATIIAKASQFVDEDDDQLPDKALKVKIFEQDSAEQRRDPKRMKKFR